MTKIQVPGEMMRVAWDAMDAHAKVHGPAVGCKAGSMCSLTVGVEAVLRYISEHPIVPTDEQLKALADVTSGPASLIVEFQRRMFLAEPEIPDPIEDLLLADHSTVIVDQVCERFNSAVREAYRRGARERWATEN